MNPKAITKINGQEADNIDAIGPFIAAGGQHYWLARIEYNRKLLTGGDYGEYSCFDEPNTEGWGWDIGRLQFHTHYAFADSCKALLAENSALQARVTELVEGIHAVESGLWFFAPEKRFKGTEVNVAIRGARKALVALLKAEPCACCNGTHHDPADFMLPCPECSGKPVQP